MERTVDDSRRISAWKGTLIDIADIFDLAAGLLRDASDGDGQASITVEHADGEARYDLDEFRQHALTDTALRTASGFRGRFSAPELQALLRFGGDEIRHAASVNVAGSNAVSVHGVAAQLNSALDEGRRKVIPPDSDMKFMIAGLLLVTVGAGLSWLSYWLGATFGLAGWSCVLVSGYAIFLQQRIVPPLELLDESNPESRVERWRRRLVGLFPLLIAAAFGAVVTVLLERL